MLRIEILLYKIRMKKLILTANRDLRTPLKCGQCVMHIFGGNHQDSHHQQYVKRIDMYHNRRMNQIHMELNETKPMSDQFFGDARVYKNLPFAHSDACPNQIFEENCKNENLEPDYSSKDQRIAVCMAIFDKNDHILLTRRLKSMRIFPNAWVIPGGHVDYNETLEQSVVREINEEIGISLNKEELT